MKKTLCALCCVGALTAAESINQVELSVGMTNGHKMVADIFAHYKDMDKVAAKLHIGYSGFNDKLKNGNITTDGKIKKDDYELEAYLGSVFLDNGTTDFSAYVLGGYHFTNIKISDKKDSANGFALGGLAEVTTIVTDSFKLGMSVEYKHMFSPKAFDEKVKDDRLQAMVRGDYVISDGFYVGAKLGMMKKKLSVGDFKYNKNQFIGFLTAGINY